MINWLFLYGKEFTEIGKSVLSPEAATITLKRDGTKGVGCLARFKRTANCEMISTSLLTKIITKEDAPWIVLILFFLVLSFVIVPAMQEGNTIIDRLIFSGYLVGTTILARYIFYIHHHKKARPSLNFITLLYVPLLYIYMIGVEICANTYRLFEPGFLYPHLKFHIFDDTLIIVVIALIMWSLFQKFRVGKKTLTASYILGVIFESFFAGEEGYGIFAGLLSGLLWIWVSHFPWLYTSLLIKRSKIKS